MVSSLAPTHCGYRHATHQTTRKRPSPRQSLHRNSTHPLRHPHAASFSSSARRPAQEKNHYETLGLPVTASADEIKKKFYALSLKHHPDRNRTDPNASQRFARISAAYNVLGNISKRQSYDRTHGFHHTQHAHRYPPAGSHSSHHSRHASPAGGAGGGSSYAGSRPASGLSKRRGTFKGPPPSFYAHGGYGKSGRTQRTEWTFQESAFGFGFGDGGASGKGQNYAAGSGSGSATGTAGAQGANWTDFMDDGIGQKWRTEDPEDPFGFIRRNPLSYFNARAHFQRQRAEDVRRSERWTKTFQEATMRQAEESGTGSGTGTDSGVEMKLKFVIALVGFAGLSVGASFLGEFIRTAMSSKDPEVHAAQVSSEYR